MNTTPKKISKYVIKKILGQGAMGVVYLGYDEQIERYVAIKTVAFDQLNQQSSGQEFAERFIQEAKLLAKCTHPNIVTILEFGQENNMAFMVMEYIKGPSLKDVLKRKQSIPLMLVMTWFVQLLKALNEAHSQEIIHRDLKPENILLVNNKTTKLTDFGIAKSDDNETKTQIGITVGTPKYMSPEQIFGSAELGPYTDIYSLFVILYELLGHVSNINKYQAEPLKGLSSLAKHNKFKQDTLVPAHMQTFILKGLSLSHTDRYETVTEVLEDLRPLIKNIRAQSDNQVTTKKEEDNTSGFFTTGTVITQNTQDWIVEENDFDAMRDHLSELMGPMADFILTNALKNAHSQDQFIMQIAEKIDNQTIREVFVEQWRTL